MKAYSYGKTNVCTHDFADWPLKFYGFSADELLYDAQPNLDENLDPKYYWVLCLQDVGTT
jgi:predicted DNA-binding helix-hairpin-helix protein